MVSHDQYKLVKLISEQLGMQDVRLEHKLREDLGADSLDTIELFMAVEEAFKVEIPDGTPDKLTTVQDVAFFIEQYQRNR